MHSFLRCARWRSPLILVALLNLVSADGFTQCYYPDGSIPTDYFWIPCSPYAKQSACCAQGDICQENGLCYYVNNVGTGEEIYRGTCTDRTFDDPSCNSDICVTGFESTWVWTLECGSASNPTWACGPIDADGNEAATCAGAAATVPTTYISTTSTTSAHRYTAPPTVDTNEYTIITSTYVATISASAQQFTFTTTWQSTITEKINAAAAAATETSAATITVGSSDFGASDSGSSDSGSSDSGAASSTKTTGKIVIGTGVLIAIIAIPLLLILAAIGAFIFLKKRRSNREDDAIRLNSANPDSSYPPSNGPVGADQVYPYEVPVNEAKPHAPQYRPVPGPKVDTYEIDDQNAVLREKYNQHQQPQPGAGGYYRKDQEQRAELSPVTPMRSPAPMYSQVDMNGFAPVELADTSATGGFRFY